MQSEAIREHMEVIGADEEHVGTVDSIEGSHIKLTKSDPISGGEHHYIPLAWVDSVDEKVHLSMDAEEAIAEWEVDETDQ